MSKILLLEPDYRHRAWGGSRLQEGMQAIGEAWIAFEGSRVQAGKYKGQSVGEVVAKEGVTLLGSTIFNRFGASFPLLIKFLDAVEWLSIQVHPNNTQAEQLEGAGACGKSEAWHILEAAPDAYFLAGVKPGTSAESVEGAISTGEVIEIVESVPARVGETVMIVPGTLHALGPGILLYEVQQASDLTYRVYDWGRPASLGRQLHLEQSAAVIDPRIVVETVPSPDLQGTESVSVVACDFFELEAVRVMAQPFQGDTRQQCFHILTVTEGSVDIDCGDEQVRLTKYTTALIAGSAGKYEIHAVEGDARLLKAHVPELAHE